MDKDCMPSGCPCSGHRMPGVFHLVPCCDRLHIDAIEVMGDIKHDIYTAWAEVEKVLKQKEQEGNDDTHNLLR